MDKFAQDAFKKAEQQRLDKEATAWSNIDTREKAAVILTAALASGHHLVKVLDLARKAGKEVENALHAYEKYLIMGGFSLGYKAGQESMLEK